MKILLIILAALFLSPANSHAPTDFNLVKHVDDRAVLVQVECEDGSGWGSGTLLKSDKILTAEHVITDSEECDIFIKRGKEKRYKALVIKSDKDRDLALLTVNHEYNVNTVFAKSKLGESLINISYPAQFLDTSKPYKSVLFGNVSTKNIKVTRSYRDRISVPIYRGSSGSCVFNSIGQCVGVVVSGHLSQQGYFYTTPGFIVERFLR